MYVYTCMYVYIYVYMYICIYVCMCVYIYRTRNLQQLFYWWQSSSCPQVTLKPWASVQGKWLLTSQDYSSDFTFTFRFHPLEREMATHSSVLALRIPELGEPGGLPSMGSHRVGHDWSDLAAAAGMLYLFGDFHPSLSFAYLTDECQFLSYTGSWNGSDRTWIYVWIFQPQVKKKEMRKKLGGLNFWAAS